MRRALAVLFSLFLLAAPALAAEPVAEDDYAKGLELFRAGRYEAALPYFESALDLAKSRYGADSPAIAPELNNLAEVYRLTGRLGEAEKLYKRAIELDERGGGEGSGLATSLNNLALVYRAQKKYDEAEKLYNRSLGLLEKSLGPNHPDVARALNNLAVLYRTKGEPERARPLQQRALAIAESTLGRDHPTTEVLRRNLAALDKGAAPARSPAAAPSPAAPVDEAMAKPVAAKPPVISAMPPPPPAAGTAPPPAETAAAPAAPPDEKPPPPAAGNGAFALQLAAVPDPAQVDAEWKRLKARYPALKELDLRAPQTVEVPGKGTFYRIIAGSFASRADAEAMCARLRQAGAACRLARP
ncbi:tetratricopeptide repeat protein [Benzoatithermus flavus]|uniref:Tetratricopeptide repeat protein n=1 Tax=Benzoatithermus flavus TaxID=3108223 RepID=A0ABU8XPX9_9PROT